MIADKRPGQARTIHNILIHRFLIVFQSIQQRIEFMKKTALCLLVIVGMFSCRTEQELPVTIDPASVKYMHQLESSMNDIIVYDIFSAPVASRIYAYSSLAAFEAVRWMDPSYPSLTKQLNGFSKMPAPERGKEYDFRISAVRAF